MAEHEQSSHVFALPPGTMLHEFRIETVLGHGGFGITYRAVDTALRKAVAIKEYLPNELAARMSDSTVRAKSSGDQQQFEDGVVAFLDEARLVARLQHKNIMEVLRFFKANGTGYIVLRYEQGRTLKQRLDDGPLGEAELRHVLGGLLDGIEVLHNEAILHRDIKPSNIILSDSRVPGERGVPVLIDFGAARDFRSRHSRSVTTIVAPGYAPPEQYGVGGQAGPWSDLYALGATAYRCVTGQAPPEALRRLRKDPYVPAVEAAAGRYDENLLHLIDQMLAVDEEQRPQSAAEVREALRARGRPPALSARDRRPMAADAIEQPKRAWRLSAGLLGGLAIAAVAVGATLFVTGTLPKFLDPTEVKTAAGQAPSQATAEPKMAETPKVEPTTKPAAMPKSEAAAPGAEAALKADPPAHNTRTATAAPAEAGPTPVVKRTLVDAIAAGFEPVAKVQPLAFTSIAISPDGLALASSTSAGQVKLWDIANNRELRLLTRAMLPPVDSASRARIAFSPDGQTLAIGSVDNTVTLWDVASGRELRKFKSNTFSLAFSPDGRTLASGSSDRTIKLWDVASGRELRTLHLNDPSFGLAQPVSAIAFSPLGRVLASGALASLTLWDVTSGRELWRKFGRATSVAFSPDGRMLATGADSLGIVLWDVASGRRLRTLEMANPSSTVQSIMFAPDGRTLASGVVNQDPGIRLWDVATGRELRTLPGDSWNSPIAFLPDGRTLAAGSGKGGTINFWSTSDGSLQARYVDMDVYGSISFDGKGLPIAVSGDESQIYYFAKDGKGVAISEMRKMGYDLPQPNRVFLPADHN